MVFRSDFPDVAPIDLPLHDAVLGDISAHADVPALIDGVTGRSLTYRQLDVASRRTAAGLAEAGVRPGDVVALYSHNTIAYPVAFFGATRAGATVTTVNSLTTAAELTTQLRDSGARWIITHSAFLHVAVEAAKALDDAPIAEIFVCDQAEGRRSLADLQASTALEPTPVIDPANDIAALPYSSGTTGMPKGVMLTHQSIATNLAQGDALIGGVPGERVMAVLPFFHIYGLAVLMCRSLRLGQTVVVLPRFDLEQFLRTIQDHRVEGLFVAPPIVLALAKHPLVDRYDLSSIRFVLSGAAPLDADLAEAAARRLGLLHVHQGYGMTELSPVTNVVPLDDPNPSRGSVGRLFPSTELRIVSLADPDQEVGPGEDGELLFKGPQVMKGYFGRPGDTGAMIDADGWLHTGDVGHVDERGYLYVVDRVKELIKYKGYQVAPAELEALLLTHPLIVDAAVVGVVGPDGEERPKAYVVRAPGAELTEDQVIDFVADHVAPYKKVRMVEFLDAVPKSASGKILRRELRKRTV